MITLRRNEARQHERRRAHESWLTFYACDGLDPLATGFDNLELLDEYRISPASRMPRQVRGDREIITYVREGSLAHEDSAGKSGVLQAGEFQCTTAGRRVRYSEANASRVDWVHVIRATLRASQLGLSSEREHRRFSVAQRRGGLCAVASADGRRGSLKLHQDSVVHSALLDAGQHVAYELEPEHSAWLHVVCGSATLSGLLLTRGDGAGIQGEPAVSFTAMEETELLLFDLADSRGR